MSNNVGRVNKGDVIFMLRVEQEGRTQITADEDGTLWVGPSVYFAAVNGEIRIDLDPEIIK